MTKINQPLHILRATALVVFCGICAMPLFAQQATSRLSANKVENTNPTPASPSSVKLVNGTRLEVDEVWEDAQGVRYRLGNVTHLVERALVSSIEHGQKVNETQAVGEAQRAKVVAVEEGAKDKDEAMSDAAARNSSAPNSLAQPVWIYLVGGARVEADEVTETTGGAWYKRGSLQIFLEAARIERIERERPALIAKVDAANASRARGWSTGNAKLDGLIRRNGAQYGVDPYLIFCVMEQESHFNTHAVSPVGARGLMQLMPGTGARFGVRRPFDAAENVAGGTRYLKQLLGNFGGRVDLVLASYNAGEGAVMKYGRTVPPYRETRNYVKRIGARYGQMEVAQTRERNEREVRMREALLVRDHGNVEARRNK
jgi:soluble lytic murein transglycosylase-like protein